MDTESIVTTISSGYALPIDTARSIVRCVLLRAASDCQCGWSRDDFCPPDTLRGECRDDCTACHEAATEAMRRG